MKHYIYTLSFYLLVSSYFCSTMEKTPINQHFFKENRVPAQNPIQIYKENLRYMNNPQHQVLIVLPIAKYQSKRN